MSDNLTTEEHTSTATKHHDLESRIALAVEEHGGLLPFDKYIHLALYTPHLGYYQSGNTIFGPQGDFITAPMISPIYSQCLANQCGDILANLENGKILELGAGTGIMAADLLKQLDTIGHLPDEYLILETSAYLKARQKETLHTIIPHLFDRITWLDELPIKPISGVILGNEVLDAMPFKRFHWYQNTLQEVYVTHDHGSFRAVLDKPTDALVKHCTQLKLPNLDRPYESECNLYLKPWLSSLNSILTKGVILLMDYGYPENSYYHPQRHNGTLMCFYRQQKHANPFVNIGEQDMTAHVNFSDVAKSAKVLSLQTLGFCPQFSFLMGCDIESLMQKALLSADIQSQALLSQAMNQLCSPAEMGEVFKVIALGKQYNQPLRGFQLINQKESLL